MQEKTSKTLTEVGEKALEYIANPAAFPKDCPDPRKDAQAFSDYIKRTMEK